MKKKIILFAALSLSGCDSFRNMFGLDHYQPDEFNISGTPPLSMPTDYKLRPPSTKGPDPLSETNLKAEKALLGKSALRQKQGSDQSLEKTLQNKVQKTQKADPDIRKTVDEESSSGDSSVLAQKLKKMKKEAADNFSSINKSDDEASSSAALSGEE